ncbi:hypothetical protein [Listeria booriae]|uniref:hypothetical protein n=1 Tax=Listeria booriae TaxID=1552123 RepID=UPI00162861D4|nr:hypothetical protein [Listeria booriae]MBC2303357.1 hypothetical protein [Listeria booriae]
MTKQEIFKAAHKLAKTFEGNYSACFALALRTVYAEAKTSRKEIVALKSWFVKKHEMSYALSVADFDILKETEKAYYLNVTSDFGTFAMWAPKSVCLTHAEYCSEEDAKVSRYESAIAFAKENGIKGIRAGLKMKTILAKIEAAGLKFVA